jgi:hypothetical protein
VSGSKVTLRSMESAEAERWKALIKAGDNGAYVMGKYRMKTSGHIAGRNRTCTWSHPDDNSKMNHPWGRLEEDWSQWTLDPHRRRCLHVVGQTAAANRRSSVLNSFYDTISGHHPSLLVENGMCLPFIARGNCSR